MQPIVRICGMLPLVIMLSLVVLVDAPIIICAYILFYVLFMGDSIAIILCCCLTLWFWLCLSAVLRDSHLTTGRFQLWSQ